MECFDLFGMNFVKNTWLNGERMGDVLGDVEAQTIGFTHVTLRTLKRQTLNMDLHGSSQAFFWVQMGSKPDESRRTSYSSRRCFSLEHRLISDWLSAKQSAD